MTGCFSRIVNTFFSWFSLANFYLIFFFLGRQHLNETTFGGAGDELFAAVRLVYLFTMIGNVMKPHMNRTGILTIPFS